MSAIPLVFLVRKPNVPVWVIGVYGLLFAVGLWGIVTLAIQVGVPPGVVSLVLQFSAFFTVLMGMFSFLVWSSLFSPLPLVGLALLIEGYSPFEQFATQFDGLALFSIGFQVYVTTVFGYWAWNWLISRYPLSNVAPLSLLVPVFGLLGSSVIFGETVGYGKALAAVLILFGLIVITSAQWIRNKAALVRSHV